MQQSRGGPVVAELPRATAQLLQQSVALNELSTVVAQLLYNAVDAGATQIEVSMSLAQCFLRVSDNGKGITKQDLALLPRRFHSSKPYSPPKLVGWRGLSLHSLQSMCESIKITSKPRRAASSSSSSSSTSFRGLRGCSKMVQGSKTVEFADVSDNASPLHYASGTVVEISGLFANLAVRRKMMLADPAKTITQCVRNITTAMLVFPGCSVKVINLAANQVVLSLPSRSSLTQRFASVSRLPNLSSALRGVAYKSERKRGAAGVTVHGVIGLLASTQPISRSNQCMFVNGRAVTCKLLATCLDKLHAKQAVSMTSMLQSQNNQTNRSGVSAEGVSARTVSKRVHLVYVLHVHCERKLFYPLEGKAVAEIFFKDLQPVSNALTIAVMGEASHHHHHERGGARKPRAAAAVDPLFATYSFSSTPTSGGSSSSSSSSVGGGGVKRKLSQVSRASLEQDAAKRRAAHPYQPEVEVDRISPFSLHACNQVMAMLEQGTLPKPAPPKHQQPKQIDFSGGFDVGAPFTVKQRGRPASSQPPRTSVESMHRLWSQSRSDFSARPLGNRTNATLYGTNHACDKEIVGRTESKKLERGMLSTMKVLGQVDHKFIVCLSVDGTLVALDQHACHERVLLETFEAKPLDFNRRMLNPPVLLKWSAADIADVILHEQTLAQFGFTLDSRDRSHVLLTGLPSVKGTDLTADDLLEYVWSLRETKALPAHPAATDQTDTHTAALPPAFRRIWASKACRSAIMFGDELTKDECTTLLAMLLECSFPFNCAHGRPTLHPLVKVLTPATLQGLGQYERFALRINAQ
jgi:DNA mismatch repair ATPase MutL